MSILPHLKRLQKIFDGANSAKARSLGIADLYFADGSPAYVRKCERILNCSNDIVYVVDNDINSLTYGRCTFEDARWCNVRHCSFCQFARARKLRAKFLKVFTFENIQDFDWIFLTLTVKNCQDNEINSTIKWMNKAWQRLIQRKAFPAQGFLRSFEITMQHDRLATDGKIKKSSGSASRSKDGHLMAHPHLHVVLCMKPGYYETNFKDKDWWIDQWQSCLGVDYRPSISIKKIYDYENDLISALLETLKYTTKPADFDLTNPCAGEWLYALTRELHKVRAISVGGNIAKFCPQSDIDSIEDNTKSDDEHKQTGIRFPLSWNDTRNKFDVVSGHIIIETNVLYNSPFIKTVPVPRIILTEEEIFESWKNQ
jgi:plasmid rolling circle replication initiator protein Rep